MKTIKIVLWIFVLYIIQNVFYPIMSVSGIVPDLIVGFAVSYPIIEPRLRKASPIIIICAVIAGTGTGRIFPVVTLFCGFASTMSYLTNGQRSIPNTLRVALITVICVYLMSVTEYFVLFKEIKTGFLIGNALWHTLYSAVAASIIYIAVKTKNKKKDKNILVL